MVGIIFRNLNTCLQLNILGRGGGGHFQVKMEDYCSGELICDVVCVLSIRGSIRQIQEGRKNFMPYEGKHPIPLCTAYIVRWRAKVLSAHTDRGFVQQQVVPLSLLFPGRSQSILLYSTKLPFPLNCQNRKMCCDLFIFFLLEIVFLPWLCSSPVACSSRRCHTLVVRLSHHAFLFP